MCGRYNLRASAEELTEAFQAISLPGVRELFAAPRYNICPTQSSLVCRLVDGQRELVPMRWGLIPNWVKDNKISAPMINARAETIQEKPSFRSAYKRRRCLVPLTGFYEWRREGSSKTPFHIHRTDDRPFAAAGIWESWNDTLTFSIITTVANDLMYQVHDRMPVLLEPAQFEIWMNPEIDPDFLASLLEPREWHDIELTQVSDVVNSTKNETPECVLPV